MAFPVESDFSFLKVGSSQSRKIAEKPNKDSSGDFSDVLKQSSAKDNPDRPESNGRRFDGQVSKDYSFLSQQAGSEVSAVASSVEIAVDAGAGDSGAEADKFLPGHASFDDAGAKESKSETDETMMPAPFQAVSAEPARKPDIEVNLSEADIPEIRKTKQAEAALIQSAQGAATQLTKSDAYGASEAIVTADPDTFADAEMAAMPDQWVEMPNTIGMPVSVTPQPAAEHLQSRTSRTQADVQPYANPAATISLAHPIANPAGTLSVSSNSRLGESLPANNPVATAEMVANPAMHGNSFVSAAISESEIRPRMILPGTAEANTDEVHPHLRDSVVKHDTGEGGFDPALVKGESITALGNDASTSKMIVATGTPGHAPDAIGLVSAQNAPPAPIAAAAQTVSTVNGMAAPTQGIVTASPVETVQIIAEAMEAPDDRRDRVVVQLDPPELGRVSIDFKFDARGLQHVTITGDNPEALRQMRLMHFELTQALERSGLSGQNMTFQEQQSGQQQAHQNTSGHTLNANGISDESTVVPVQLASRAPRPAISPGGGINIKL